MVQSGFHVKTSIFSSVVSCAKLGLNQEMLIIPSKNFLAKHQKWLINRVLGKNVTKILLHKKMQKGHKMCKDAGNPHLLVTCCISSFCFCNINLVKFTHTFHRYGVRYKHIILACTTKILEENSEK